MLKDGKMQNRIFYVIILLVIGGFIWYIAAAPSNTEVQSNTVNNIDTTKFSIGDENAPVKVTQYSDFLCPSCSQVSLTEVPKIVENYVDTGKVYYEFIPMAFIAPGSQIAAEGAFCAADQDKFWDFHDASYTAVWTGYFSKGVDPSRVPLYSAEGVQTIGAEAGVDTVAFNECIDSRAKQQEVKALTKQSQDNGVSGTPYFIINGTPIKGVPSYQVLEAAIKANL